MYTPSGQRLTEPRWRIRQLELRRNVEQSADSNRAVDHKPPDALHPAEEASLKDVIGGAVHFRQIGKEIVDPGADRARHTPIAIADGQENRFVKARVEAIAEAIQTLPWIVSV